MKDLTTPEIFGKFIAALRKADPGEDPIHQDSEGIVINTGYVNRIKLFNAIEKEFELR